MCLGAPRVPAAPLFLPYVEYERAVPVRLSLWPALAALLLAACSARPLETASPAAPIITPPPADLYLLRRGRHTDLIVPVENLDPHLSSLLPDVPGARYLVFGFGDKQYVLAFHQNLWHTLLAPLPGPGLILVTGLKDTPERIYGEDHLLALSATPPQLQGVDAFVWASLAQDPPGVVRPYMPGKLANNVYYASTHTYHGFYTCNTWTADALRAGGLPVRSGGVLFAGQVWDQALDLKARQAP